jgi:hypothetical protein
LFLMNINKEFIKKKGEKKNVLLINFYQTDIYKENNIFSDQYICRYLKTHIYKVCRI